MIKRVITALIAAPTAAFVLVKGGPLLLGVILLSTLVVAYELGQMLKQNGIQPVTWLANILIAGIVVTSYLPETRQIWTTPWMGIWVLGWIGFYLWELFSKKTVFPQNRWLATLRVVNFVVCTIPFFGLMREQPVNGLLHIFFCCFVTWTGDIGAMLGGKYWGKHKLAPSISPNKTVEGSAAGLAVGLMVCLGFVYLFNLPLLTYVGLALIIGLFSQLGDLHESLIKRRFDVKDSSSILPGHGGFYDRGDGAFFAVPVLYYLLYG